MKILFVASAGLEEGTGHVIRVLKMSRLLSQKSHSVSITGPIKVDWVNDFAKSLDIDLNPIEKSSFDLIVIDSYRIDFISAQLNRFRANLTVQICDLNTPILDVDGFLWLDCQLPNSAVHRSRGELIAAGIEFMTGSDFNQIPKYESSAKNVLITLGGAPTSRDKLRIVELLSGVEFDAIDFHFLSQNENFVTKRNFSWYQLTGQMESLVKLCDTVITNAGTSLWELLPSSRVVGTICLVENQRSNYDYVVSRKLSAGLGDSTLDLDLNVESFRSLFFDNIFRKELFDNALNNLKHDGRSSLVEVLEEFALRKMKDSSDKNPTE